jgi:hypothetical protein
MLRCLTFSYLLGKAPRQQSTRWIAPGRGSCHVYVSFRVCCMGRDERYVVVSCKLWRIVCGKCKASGGVIGQCVCATGRWMTRVVARVELGVFCLEGGFISRVDLR